MILEILIITFAVFIFIALCLIGWTIGTYNFFQTAKQDIANMFSNIKTEYQRRYDLFMNLVETVKSYKNHEKETFIGLANARSQLMTAGKDNIKAAKAMKKMDSIFAGMKINVEAYPELKANETHKELMTEIRITEDRINMTRTTYNDVINEYNTRIKTFPGSIVAGMFGFRTETYYINETISDKAPKIGL